MFLPAFKLSVSKFLRFYIVSILVHIFFDIIYYSWAKSAFYHSLVNVSTSKQKRIWNKFLKRYLTKTYGQRNVWFRKCLSKKISGWECLLWGIVCSGKSQSGISPSGICSWGSISQGTVHMSKSMCANLNIFDE